jgi:cytoskeleton protein RodZ
MIAADGPGFSAQELGVASFGEGLKREREKKKIALEQVAVSTKISVRMLRALEEEKFDQLPGGIFNKGFVRAYARHLGLDEEQAVADYLAASTPAQGPRPEDLELRAMAEQKDRERQRQARLTRDFPWGWVATVLLFIALGFSLWGVRSGRETQSGKAVVAESPAQNETLGEKHETQGEKAVVTQSVAKPGLSSATEAIVKNPPPQYSPAAASEKPVPPTSTRVDGSFTVLVTAEDDSWLSITADGETIFTGTLIAPGELLVHAKISVVIRAGNLGGLDIDFNGKRLASQGDYGEAKTLTFDGSGLKPQPKQDE